MLHSTLVLNTVLGSFGVGRMRDTFRVVLLSIVSEKDWQKLYMKSMNTANVLS